MNARPAFLIGTPLTTPPDAYQARTVHDGHAYDLGRGTGYRDAILRAEKAGPGSTVVAVDSAGIPLTRDDGTEYVVRLVD